MKTMLFALLGLFATQLSHGAALNCASHLGKTEFEVPRAAMGIFGSSTVRVTIPRDSSELFEYGTPAKSSWIVSESVRIDFEHHQIYKRLRGTFPSFEFVPQNCERGEGFHNCLRTLDIVKTEIAVSKSRLKEDAKTERETLDCALDYVAKFAAAISQAYFNPITAQRETVIKPAAVSVEQAHADAKPGAASGR